MTAFVALLVVVATVMLTRQVRARPARGRGQHPQRLNQVDDPIITFSPHFACACPRALKVLVSATVVGLLTGFLGVGGGFLVVPALVLALGPPMELAAGTSLVVITITSTAVLVVRAGTAVHPDWTLVGLLTVAAVIGGWLGARVAARVETDRLQPAFTLLLIAVAAYTAAQAVPALT